MPVSISAWKAATSSAGFMSLRSRFSARLTSIAVSSSTIRTGIGVSAEAIWARASSRRWPAADQDMTAMPLFAM
jgi:hypothetical protein